jgi:hypothetical protein
MALTDQIAPERNIGELLEILTATHESGRGGDRRKASG